MIPIRGAPRGRTLQGHLAPWEHHGGDAGGANKRSPPPCWSWPSLLLLCRGPPAQHPQLRAPFPTQTAAPGAPGSPPPEPAGGQGPGPPVPERVPTPRYRDAPRSPGSACSEVCRQRGGKKTRGGEPGPLWGLQLPPPACCRALLCPTAEENSLTLQKYWSQVAPTVTSLSKTQPAARPSTPWAERGGAGPQGQHGALGGGTARPRVPPLPPEKERAGRRGVFGCVVLVIINISFWHQHHLVT